jgi:hypothetical protein
MNMTFIFMVITIGFGETANLWRFGNDGYYSGRGGSNWSHDSDVIYLLGSEPYRFGA